MSATASKIITIDLTDLDSIADAVRAGITTIAQAADVLELDLDDTGGYLVLPGTKWTAADESGAEIVCDAESAEEAAAEYVEGGDWGDRTSTTWIHVSVWRDGLNEDGEKVRACMERDHTVTLDPETPDCVEGEEHIWREPVEIVGGLEENPGCFGSGGGVIQHSVCMRCGCKRSHDSWATDPSNGTQGHSSTSYQEKFYAEDVHELHMSRAKDELDAELVDGEYRYTKDGTDYTADSDDMATYGQSLICGDDASLPGCEVESASISLNSARVSNSITSPALASWLVILDGLSPQECFALGVEWQMIREKCDKPERQSQTIHAENKGRVEAMLKRAGRKFSLRYLADDVSEAWMELLIEEVDGA